MNNVHRDLGLYFQVHKIGNDNIWKTVSSIEKMSIITFISVNIRHPMKPLPML